MQLPKTLSRIAPSTYAGLLECALRGCLASNRDQPSPIVAGPIAQLGSITHRLLSLAAKGDVLECEVERRWNELIADKETQLKSSSSSSWMVPLRETAFRFSERAAVALAHARNLAREVASIRQVDTRRDGKPGNTPLRTEEWMTTPDGKVGGQMDFLLETPDGAIIRDFKTGAIFEKCEEGAAEPPELKEAYKLQMQLYAGMYFEVRGVWPSRVELVPLCGEPEIVPIVPSECQQLLQNAKAKLDEINQLLAGGDDKPLANPHPSTCKYCSYRPECATYKAASGMNPQRSETTAVDRWPLDAAGVIKESAELHGDVRFTLDNGIRVNVPRQLHPELHSAPVGTALEFYNLIQLRSGAFEAWRGCQVFFV